MDGALNGLWLLPVAPSNPGDLAWTLALGCAAGAGGGGDGPTGPKPGTLARGNSENQNMTRALRKLAQEHGIGYEDIREAFHDIKASAGLRPSQNTILKSNGDVINDTPGTDTYGEVIGNVLGQ